MRLPLGATLLRNDSFPWTRHSARAANDPLAYCGAGRTFRTRGMFSPRRNPRADCWLRERNVPHAPQYACGSLAARAECSPRAAMRVRVVGCARGECSPRTAIRVRIVGCARGTFSPRRNTRADRWLRARDDPPRAAIHVRIVGCARGMFSPHCNTRADRWLRARNVLPASQYACWSLAAP